jgi:proliferating cell nuclear antigen PCNA
MKILNINTEHTAPLKTLFEVLKEILVEANIEFINNDLKKSTKSKNNIINMDSDSDEENNSDDEDEKTQTQVKKFNGMKIMATDMSNTILIYLKLDAENFKEFDCKKKRIIVGVNFSHLNKIFKTVEKDDNLSIYINKNEENLLGVKLENFEKKKIDKFEMKLMDLNNTTLTLPTKEFDSAITMDANEFHKICREMNGIADYINIECINKKVIFSCIGDELGRKRTLIEDTKSNIRIDHTVNKDSKNNEPKIVKGNYELKNLILFSKCQSLCNTINIYMKNNYPLFIKYSVATLGTLHICVANNKPPDDEASDNEESKDNDFSDNESVDSCKKYYNDDSDSDDQVEYK